MKNQDTGIFNYNITHLYADAGKPLINPDFFVFSVEEIANQEHKFQLMKEKRCCRFKVAASLIFPY